MAGSSEKVHFMADKVRHKKRDGVLYLMSERIAWCPQGKNHFEASHQYAEIKCQKISPESKAKIQLQIVMLNGESKTFHFADTSQEKAKEQRNTIKDILSEMLPRFRRKIDKDLEEKNKLLQQDPELLQTYKDLVGSQAITPEEFWATHAEKLPSDKASQSKQSVGVSASFLADVKPQSDGCNGLRYNLTADRIESIFRTYPAVKKKYLDKVPDKMTEKEFWTMFFQSHYFHRDRVNQNSKDLFSDCAKRDDQDILSLLKLGVKDPLVNLLGLKYEDLSKDEGYGNSSGPAPQNAKVKQSSTQIMNKAIIKRFNHQSTMILSTSASSDDKALNGNTENGQENDDGSVQAKKARLIDSTLYDDLSASKTATDSSLNLQNSERYSHGPTLLSEVHEELEGRAILDGLRVISDQCASYKPKLGLALTSKNASLALSDLSADARSRASISDSFIDQILPGNLRLDLQYLYASASELLRHFWLCFPVNTPFLQEKVVRMNNSIHKFRDERLATFKHSLVQNRVEVNVAKHLEDMLNNAINKFNSWQTRMTKKR
ncbi:general transcription factor IIH subunit 1-like [Styela clava]